ncbi:MAG: hypothetical protein M0R22_06355 [Dehalococcoidia bacterium]|nr:hypothetical protein [Dehalococcoidia bacterium]
MCEHYEKRGFKKALVSSTKILEGFPNHADTLAMRGLTMYSAPQDEGGDKVEGVALIKRALAESRLSSFICWHVYGLYYRAEHQWAEAVKCYKSALKNAEARGADQMLVLRDLALLQAQLRDFQGLLETRKKIMHLKPSIVGNGVALAVAAHLAGDRAGAAVAMAVTVEAFRAEAESRRTSAGPAKRQADIQARQNAWLVDRHELGELQMFRTTLIEDLSGPKAAIAHLDRAAPEIADKLGLRERRAALLLASGQAKEAEQAYRDLIRINQENAAYQRGLIRAMGLDGEAASRHCAEMCSQWPSSWMCRVMRLDSLEGAAWSEFLTALLVVQWRRGVPSMFQMLKASLYRSEATSLTTGAVAEALLAAVDSPSGRLPGAGGPDPEPPTSKLWALHFAAQHASHVGQTERALALIGRAQEHSPTVVDVQTARARILRHAGDAAGASEAYERARKMDLADQYLNSRSCRYLLRAGKADQAISIIALFLKEGAGSPQAVIADMQCSWFEYELGLCYAGQREFGKALRRFSLIEKHYSDISEDQFNFHYYCTLRRYTLGTYVALLRLEDELLASRMYVKAAVAFIRTYISLDDSRKNPRPASVAPVAAAPVAAVVTATAAVATAPASAPAAATAEETGKLSKAQKKKKKAEEAKALAAKQQQQQQQQQGGKGKERKDDDEKPKELEDLDGLKLLAAEDPLKDAERLAHTLIDSPAVAARLPIEAHVAVCELFVWRKNLQLAAKELRAAKKLDAQSPEVLKLSVLLFHESSQAQPATLVDVLKEEHESIAAGGATAVAVAEGFLKSHSGSATHVAAVSEALAAIAPEKKQACLSALLSLPDSANPAPRALDAWERVYKLSRDAALGTEDEREMLRAKCRRMFPLAGCFKSDRDIAAETAATASAAKPQEEAAPPF